MLEKIALGTAPWLARGSETPVGRLLLHRVPSKVYLHLAIFGAFSLLALVVIWPTLGRDFPPGVDSPTFLHLAWVTQQAVLGNLDNPFSDPYWYGGFPYMEAYPPLGYGVVGLLGAIPGFSFVVIHQALLVMGLGGIGTATYWLGREFNLRWWTAALAGILASIAYPVLSSVFLWGWFSSVLALPLALVAVILLERAARTGNWKSAAWGGLFLGISTLVHHMTGAAFVLGLIGWFGLHVAVGRYARRHTARSFALFGAVTALVVLPWGVPFLIHVLDVGFRREIPGNWLVPISFYRPNILDSDFIGSFTYPSYLGSGPFLALAVAATVYALARARRIAGAAAMLLVFTWFSLGADANPLIRLYPFSGLDVARFPLYMLPLMALLVAWLLNTAFAFAEPLVARFIQPRWKRLWPVGVSLVLAGLLVLPVLDMVKARDKMESYQVPTEMAAVVNWLSELPPDDQGTVAARVFCVGCWNWDAFLIPYQAKVAVVDGWADEGAPNVRQVRPLRRTTWTFDQEFVVKGQGQEIHRMLTELGATHVILAPYYPLEDAEGFREEFGEYPQLFPLRQEWGPADAPVEVYEVLPRPESEGPMSYSRTG